MVFDYEQFFEDYGIEHYTSGPNAARGELNISCPFCGPDDPSRHMNVNPETGVYGCWRNSSHSGKSAACLVRAFLKCSWDDAYAITKESQSVRLENFTDKIQLLMNSDNKQREMDKNYVDFNSTFNRIENVGAGRKYCKYLKDRGFDDPVKLADTYNLRYGKQGEWSQRIIIPLKDESSNIVGWVGRSIRDDAFLRYKALSLDDGAAMTTKETIFRPPGIEKGGEYLYIVEGPFDALKLDYYGNSFGLRATCLFGLNWNDYQIYQLQELTERFNRVVIMLDRGESMKAMVLQSSIGCATTVASIPKNVDDPGSMSRDQVESISL